MMRSADEHKTGEKGKPTRQFGNEAFAAYIFTLEFPEGKDVNAVFSCSLCEITLLNGEKIFTEVFTDGTPARILKKLPDFHPDNRLVLPVPRTSGKQYLMRVSKHRYFMECLFKSCWHTDQGGVFGVPLSAKLWRIKEEVQNAFLSESPPMGKNLHRLGSSDLATSLLVWLVMAEQATSTV